MALWFYEDLAQERQWRWTPQAMEQLLTEWILEIQREDLREFLRAV